MNKVVVKIQGSEYNIVSSKNPDQMKTIARYIDEEMRKVKEGNTKLNSVTTSIVACLNIADILFDCSEENEALNKELQEIKDSKFEPNEEIKIQIDKTREELEQKDLEIIEKDYRIDEMNSKVIEKNNEIENLNKVTEELKLELEKYKSEIDLLKEEVQDASERALIAEHMSSQWQNKTYELQLKNTQLEGQLKSKVETL